MKATVQYNDYQGTTAADRSDLFLHHAEIPAQYITESFNLSINPEEYDYQGVSIYGTNVNNMGAYFIFRKRRDGKIIRCSKDVRLQEILDMFKRFEFQVGRHLEDIDESTIEDID